MASKLSATLLVLGLLSLNAVGSQGALQFGFYRGKCNGTNVEVIIQGTVKNHFRQDATITSALLRMLFHDCFVSGCDASLLLDGPSTEKNAGPNVGVRGFELIDEIKAALERRCPGVVSCADIIVAATRDAVVLAGGWRYKVQLGRRDGLVSAAGNVNLPGPSTPVANAIAAFRGKGLTVFDMVLLMGAHTVGTTRCSLFSDRLWNFRGTGRPDPTMSPLLLSSLQRQCPSNGSVNNAISLDQNLQSTNTVDNSYYKNILLRKGVLEIDQSLALDPATRNMVRRLSSGSSFNANFGNALNKLAAVQVLTGAQGEIRRSCRATN